jgi:hypothetical protein
MEVTAVHHMIAAAGGPSIRWAPYAPYGTEIVRKSQAPRYHAMVLS